MNNLEMSKFIENWKSKYERKNFIISNESDQKKLVDAIEDIKKYIINSSTKACFIAVADGEKLNDIYIRIFYD